MESRLTPYPLGPLATLKVAVRHHGRHEGCRVTWRPGVAERLGYYVYLLIDPRTDIPFYVGKGVGGRCFSHIAEARRTTADSAGDYVKLATITSIQATANDVRIEILRPGLDDETAFHVEAAAIDLLGLADLSNRVIGLGSDAGRMTVADINSQYGATPVDFDHSHRVVLIRISRAFRPGMTDDEIYEATRKWWKMSPSCHRPEIAMAVYDGVVRGEYRIKEWLNPSDDDVKEDPARKGRWGFSGTSDPALEARYRYADVTAVFPRGAQNPITYVNC